MNNDRCLTKLAVGVVSMVLLAAGASNARALQTSCSGDCNGDSNVSVDELLSGVNILLGEADVARCPAFDTDGDAQVTIDEVVGAVKRALVGCPSPDVNGCNGYVELCDRRYDQVAYATTHNSMSNADEGFQAPNQHHPIARQLEDGVRGLLPDIYEYEGDVYLCHADCAILGHRPLVEGLTAIRLFLQQHPNEVVSIIFEAYVSAEKTAEVFERAGLMPFLHTQPLGEPWPTLREMIDSGRRLVVFSDRDRGLIPWYHFVWDYAFETNFSYATPADLSCTPNRGNTANSLFILNHFLTQTVGMPRFAEMINHNPLFIDRARQCMEVDHRLPNFVTVDFYDIGDVFAVVRGLNGVGASAE